MLHILRDLDALDEEERTRRWWEASGKEAGRQREKIGRVGEREWICSGREQLPWEGSRRRPWSWFHCGRSQKRFNDNKAMSCSACCSGWRY